MTFGHGKDGRVLLNEVHVSGNIQGYSISSGRRFADVTVLTTTGGHNFLPGQKTGSMSVQGLFDNAATSLHTEVAANLGVDDGALWTFWPSGGTIGRPAFFAGSDLESYELTSQVSDAVKVSVTPQPDNGVDWGVSLHDLAAETADANASSVDNGASSANGGAGALHVSAYSGLTDAVIKVQHSTNDSVWADLLTFTTVTAVTAERAVVAAGTTVNRYLRCSLDVTGTGSITFALSFARR